MATWLDRAVERRVRCLAVAVAAATALALPSGASAAASGKCRGSAAAKHHKAKPARRCRAPQAERGRSRGTDPKRQAPEAIVESTQPPTRPDAVLEV